MVSSTNDNRTILITGANGLVGSHLVRRYLSADWSVLALHRPGSDLQLLADVREQVTWVEGDILDVPSLEAAIQPGMDVIHAAAIVSFVPRDRGRMEKVNVEGTANVVNVCLSAGVRKLGFVSSVAALGRPNRTLQSNAAPVVIDETQKWEESPNNSFYAQTKYRAELEVWRGIAEGLPAIIVNPSVVLGEGDWERSSSQLFRYAYDERPFYTDGLTNLVDVRDVAEALFRLMESPIVAERFVLNAATMPYRELLDRMADAFGRKRPYIRIAPALTQIIWRMEAIRSLITGKAPLITRETARSASRAYRFDGRQVVERLAAGGVRFSYHEPEETIRRIAAYYTAWASRPAKATL